MAGRNAMRVSGIGKRQPAVPVDAAEDADGGDALDGSSEIELERIIPYVANRLTFRLNQLLKQDLKQFGLSIVEWRVLAVLAVNEQATINEIARYAMLEQPTASRLVLRMEERNLIERERDEEDGRVSSIKLTLLGRKRHQEARATALAHTDRAVAGLTDKECNQLNRLLLRMTANLDQPLKKGR